MPPDHSNTPPFTTAVDTCALLRDGALRHDDLRKSTLAHIDAVDSTVGAFACLASPEGHAMPDVTMPGPLAGLPVGVKDIFDTRELPTSYGSAIYAGGPAKADAAMVAVLRRAGASVIGKTTTTEFAFLHPTATKNPRAPGRSPGGSSAGSAAAVAAGMVALAIGTQTGGSIVRPASYCGVVGYKPSFGWLPTSGFKCFSWSLDTVGLFAADVGDVAFFAQAVTGRPLVPPRSPRSRPLMVAVPDGYPWGELSASASGAVSQACHALAAAGAQVQRCTLPDWAARGFDAHAVIQGFEARRAMAWEIDTQADRLSATLRDYLLECDGISAEAYAAAQAISLSARAAATQWFGAWDVLLTPSAPDEAPAGYASTGASTFNRVWTLLGVPCINVPGLVGTGGYPMGVQLVAPFGADGPLLEAAAVLEAALKPQGRRTA